MSEALIQPPFLKVWFCLVCVRQTECVEHDKLQGKPCCRHCGSLCVDPRRSARRPEGDEN